MCTGSGGVPWTLMLSPGTPGGMTPIITPTGSGAPTGGGEPILDTMTLSGIHGTGGSGTGFTGDTGTGGQLASHTRS